MTTDERLEKVEGQLARVRWFNRCLIGCIALSLGAWFILKTFGTETAWAQSGPKEIRANKFALEDENGKTRAQLAMAKGEPELALFDENGKQRAGLGLGTGGPGLRLSDENGKARAGLFILKVGPFLVLTDENGKTRANLSEINNEVYLSLNDENGYPRASMYMDKKEGPVVSVLDENRKPIWKAP